MNYKKIIAIVTLAAAIISATAGCTGGGTEPNATLAPDTQPTAPSDPGEQKGGEKEWEEKNLTITINGKSFLVGGLESDMIAAWGEPLNVEEADSCMFDGFDKTITYDFGTIFTFPFDNSKANFVDEIYITSDAVDFGGVKVGAIKEEVIAKFGEKYYSPEGSATIVYNYAGSADQDQTAPKLYFYISGGVVTGIGVCANKYHVN